MLCRRRCCCTTGGGTPCSPCAIPKNNLTLTATNVFFGSPYTAPLIYSAGAWNTGCLNDLQLIFGLLCNGGAIYFCATYFLSGVCPTGQSQQCCTPGSDPFDFTLTSWKCSPFQLVYTVTGAGCPVLYSSGYETLTITNP